MKITQALAGDLFRSNRIGILIAFAVIPGLWALIYLSEIWFQFDPNKISGKTAIPLIFATFFFSMVFSYANFDNKEFQTGFPKHLLLLPVKTIQLVLVPVITSAITIALFYLLYHVVILQPLDVDFPVFWTLVSVVSILWWIQAVGWAFGHRPILGMLFILGAVCLIVVSAFVLNDGNSNSVGNDLKPMQYWALITLIVTSLTAVLVSFIAVKKVRSSEVMLPGKINFDLVLPGYRLKRPLSSGKWAQCWFEWRSFGYMMPGIMLFFITLIAFVYFAKAPPFDKFFSVVVLMVSMLLMSSSLTGFEMAKSNIGAKDLQISSYLLTHPLSDRDFAFAKLKVAFATVTLCWGILVVSLAALISWSKYYADFMLIWQQITLLLPVKSGLSFIALLLVASLVICWIMISNTLTFSLIGSKKLLNVSYLVFGLIVIGLLVGILYLSNNVEIIPTLLQQLLPQIWTIANTVNLIILSAIVVFIIRIYQAKRVTAQSLKLCFSQIGVTLIVLLVLRLAFLDIEFAIQSIVFLANVSVLIWLPTIAAPLAFSRRRGQ